MYKDLLIQITNMEKSAFSFYMGMFEVLVGPLGVSCNHVEFWLHAIQNQFNGDFFEFHQCMKYQNF